MIAIDRAAVLALLDGVIADPGPSPAAGALALVLRLQVERLPVLDVERVATWTFWMRVRRFVRNARAAHLRAWRRNNPMCSRCGCRVSAGVNTPAECCCYYLRLREASALLHTHSDAPGSAITAGVARFPEFPRITQG